MDGTALRNGDQDPEFPPLPIEVVDGIGWVFGCAEGPAVVQHQPRVRE